MTTLTNDELRLTTDNYDVEETQYESKSAAERQEDDAQEEPYYWSEPGVCG